MQRIRIHYAKNEALRYTGNLDMHRIWERSLRRAGLPVAYSQGFHPQPRIQQGCPLPLGFLSEAEIVDVWLDLECITPQQVETALQGAVPPGIDVRSIEPVELYEKALMGRTRSAAYQAVLLPPVELDQVAAAVAELLNAVEVVRERRGKRYDLRPLIESLELVEGQPPVLILQLAAREGATGRPEEVLEALGIEPNQARITRTAVEYQPA